VTQSLHFAAPLFLALAPLLVLAGAALDWRARGAGDAPLGRAAPRRRVSNDVLSDVLEGAPRAPRFAGRAQPWWLLGSALACVALARPQWGEIPERRFTQAREVLIALDLSRSMTATDVAPSRLERAKLLILGLLPELAGERVGFVVFAGTAFLQSPLSADTEVLRDLLSELGPDFLPQGGTNYAQMLAAALEAFSTEGASDRFLVVLSDGEAHDERWREPLAMLVARGVRVLGLGVGTAGGTVLEAPGGGVMKDERGAAVLSRLEPATLEALAVESGGAYRDAALWVDLGELIEATVARGRQGAFAETSEPRRIERFQWALAPAFLCWLLAGWLELPARTRARQLRAASPRSGRLAALLVLGLAFDPLGASPARAAEVQPDGAVAGAAPPAFQDLVAKLAERSELGAHDYAEFAGATLGALGSPDASSLGGALDASLRRALVRDGLEAVAAGERIDPAAADWKQLRERLEAQEQPEPPQQNDGDAANSGAQQRPEAKSGESSAPGTQSSDSNADAQAGQRPSGEAPGNARRDAADERGAPPAGEAASGEPTPSSDAGSPSPSEQREASDPPPRDLQRPDADAIGSLDRPDGSPTTPGAESSPAAREQRRAEPSRNEPPRGSGTRYVGGSERSPELAEHPELAGALEKQRRVREADSPARLFEVLRQADGGKAPAPEGKPW
jgi:Ca-activated chloride channel family protein